MEKCRLRVKHIGVEIDNGALIRLHGSGIFVRIIRKCEVYGKVITETSDVQTVLLCFHSPESAL